MSNRSLVIASAVLAGCTASAPSAPAEVAVALSFESYVPVSAEALSTHGPGELGSYGRLRELGARARVHVRWLDDESQALLAEGDLGSLFLARVERFEDDGSIEGYDLATPDTRQTLYLPIPPSGRGALVVDVLEPEHASRTSLTVDLGGVARAPAALVEGDVGARRAALLSDCSSIPTAAVWPTDDELRRWYAATPTMTDQMELAAYRTANPWYEDEVVLRGTAGASIVLVPGGPDTWTPRQACDDAQWHADDLFDHFDFYADNEHRVQVRFVTRRSPSRPGQDIPAASAAIDALVGGAPSGDAVALFQGDPALDRDSTRPCGVTWLNHTRLTFCDNGPHTSLAHELGHTWAGLADEYVTAMNCASLVSRAPNLSEDTDLKWDCHVGESCFPDGTGGPIGAHHTGGCRRRFVVRPCGETTTMLRTDGQFDRVATDALNTFLGDAAVLCDTNPTCSNDCSTIPCGLNECGMICNNCGTGQECRYASTGPTPSTTDGFECQASCREGDGLVCTDALDREVCVGDTGLVSARPGLECSVPIATDWALMLCTCNADGEMGSCDSSTCIDWDTSVPPATAVCGDGFVDSPGEACDDRNTTAGDGCAADCLSVETGYVCRGEPSNCREACGALRVGEARCELTTAGGCTPPQMQLMRCTAGSPPALVPEGGCFQPGSDCDDRRLYCGDGWIDTSFGEVCDDGDPTGGDGCGADCQVESGFTCRGEPSSCGRPCMLAGATIDWGARTCVRSTDPACMGFQQPSCNGRTGMLDFAGAGCFRDAACTMR